MCKLLRASLWKNENVSVPDWQAVFTEMKLQAVAALPGEWLKTHLPSAKAWLSYCGLQQGQWVRVMHGQDQLIQLLEAHNIPCVILKGAAAAMAYPHPTLRSMGDVDILVKRPDLDKAAALLEANGYELAHEKDAASHHYAYTKNGIRFELHKRFLIVSEADEELLSFFEEGIDAREWHETEGHRFPALPLVRNGLVLLFHINQHLRSGLGLRQIIDWMMFADTLSDAEWKVLVAGCRETGMERLALTVTVLCQRYLGLRKIVQEEDFLPVESLLAYLLEKGNFGRKAGMEGRMAAFALSATDKGSFFRRLQTGGMLRWKAARRHAFLRPFAWLYQGVRILGVMVKNEKNPGDILQQSRHGAAQRQLLEDLGLQVERTVVRK